MIRTHGQGKVYHGEDAARTAGDLWRDGDVFVIKTTGATYVRTGGAWVAISVGSGTTDHNSLSNFDGGTTSEYYHLTSAQHVVINAPTAPASGLLTVQGIANGETAWSGKAIFDTTAASAVSLAAGTAGTQVVAARRDHTHLVTASSAGAADAYIVATDAAGRTTLNLLSVTGLDDTVRVQVTGVAGQTTNLQQWRSSTPTVLSGINATGAWYYGNDNAASYAGAIMVRGTIPVPANRHAFALDFEPTIGATSQYYSAYGVYVRPVSVTVNAGNYGGISSGIDTLVVTAGAASYIALSADQPATLTGTLTVAYGLQVGNINKATLNYAIHTAAGRVHFGGLADYANNAAAVTAGLSAGDFYTETGTNPKRVCVVY